MEYYGNNDWRDYKSLKHYGIKGMKWGKRKLKVHTHSDSGYNQNGYKSKGLSIHDDDGAIVTLRKTKHKTKGSRYEITTRRKKTGNTYDKSGKHLVNYSDDEDYRTVGIKTSGKKKKGKNRVLKALKQLSKKK